MTDPEKAALLQFMGMAHAQAKQTDQMIVGSSQDLKPISVDISRQFEQVLRTPTESQQFAYESQPVYNAYPAPVPSEQITAYPQHQDQDMQLEFQFNPQHESEIIKQLKEINLNLVRIASILTENNVKAKTKNTIKG